jgi:carbon monoxide dehydrogenase subunit G
VRPGRKIVNGPANLSNRVRSSKWQSGEEPLAARLRLLMLPVQAVDFADARSRRGDSAMKVKNQFRVPLPPKQAWHILNDVPRVARCAPGAELLGQNPDGSFLGTVAVRLGPVALTFKGTVIYKEVDEANMRVVAEATGNETRARGTARGNVVFTLLPDPKGTRVDVDTDLQLAGAVAQYGRGAALIQSAAQAIMDDFATNFAREFKPQSAAGPAMTAPEAVASPQAAPGAHAAPSMQPAERLTRPAAKPMSIVRLLYLMIRNGLKRIFGRE